MGDSAFIGGGKPLACDLWYYIRDYLFEGQARNSVCVPANRGERGVRKSMAILPIVVDDHPTLRKQAHKVKQFDASLKRLAQDMFETMRAANGIGLAANQIDKLVRMIVVELTPDPEDDPPGSQAVRMALCNPEIVEGKGRVIGTEACLSLPGWIGEVPRYQSVTVKAQTLEGKSTRVKADGMFARVLQHEIDHLNGVLFTDRVEDLSTLHKLSPREAHDAGEVAPADEVHTDDGHLAVTTQS
jgi:peptide deformylase